jgi:hypothetical protein
MARSLDQISNDLTALEASTARIDEQLQTLYQDYLGVLGKAVKQQLVLAVYHLCTQAYPDEFLKLSVSQREKLQAGIRKIATQGQTQIEQLGQVMDLSSLSAQLEEVIATRELDEPEPFDGADSDESASADEMDLSDVVDDVMDGEADAPPLEANRPHPSEDALPPSTDEEVSQEDAELAAASKEASEMIQRLSTSLSLFSVLGAEPNSPVSLAKRHVLLERHLRAILQTLSSLANYLLKQAHILPDLPEMVIAAAAEAEAGESSPSTPNVLNVLVEIGSDRREEPDDEEEEPDEDIFEDDEDSEREMTHLVAINLRLADIEFSDTHTALWRSKLQETLLKLKRLGSRYQKLQREKARAEAEHAWRAVWFEN